MNKSYLLYCMLLPTVTLAQNLKQDTNAISEIMILENRLQTPFSKQARNIQLITKEQIAQLPVKSINEVLSYIGGVDVRQRGPFGTQADISIDGGSFEQTLILLNGMKISDVQTAHHSMNIPVPLSAIERIEILKGPAARIYGINALTGAINIVTKSIKESDLTVNLQTGSSFEKKDVGDGKGLYGGGSLQAALSIAGNKNQHLIAAGGDLYNGQRYNSETKDNKIFYQGTVQIDPDNALNIMGGYIYNAFGASGYYAAPADKESYEIVKTAIYSISSTNQVSDKFSIRPRISGRNNWDDYRFYRNELTKARSIHRTDVWSAELNSTLKSAIGDFGFGLESRVENINSTNIGDRQRYNHGVYAEYKTEAIRHVLLNVGTYLNYNTQYGWQVFPGIDAAYLFAPKWKLAFNVGSSQRIPSFTDLYLNQKPGNIGNPNLQSENAWQYELGLQYKNEGLQVQGGYFYRNISDFIDWIRNTSTVPYQPQNFGKNKVQGLNIGISHSLAFADRNTLRYDLSYNYLYADKISYAGNITSKYVLENLKHQALMRLVYGLNDWKFTLGNRWVERALKQSYLLTDFRVQYGKKQWNVYGEATNVFDKTYIEVAAVPMPGRWFAIGGNYRFTL